MKRTLFSVNRMLVGMLLTWNAGVMDFSVAAATAAVPVIHSVSPIDAPVGSVITIDGDGFGLSPGENIVSFGTIRAVVTSATATRLTVRVPVGAAVQPIRVSSRGLVASSPLPFIPTFVTLSNLSTNTFAAPVFLPSRATPHGILGDVDGDGWLDVVFANYHDSSVSLLHNSGTDLVLGTSSFPARLDFAAGSGAHTPSMGDLDGDGRPEIIVPNDFDANVSVYRNLSNPGSLTSASLAPRVNFATRNNPVSVRPADIDGDGRLDLVVVNAVVGPSTLSVHRNTVVPGGINSNSFAAGVHFTTGQHSFWNEVGDLDGDGKPDVVVANVREATLSVLRNTSTPGVIDGNSLAPAFALALPVRAQTLQLVDFDGDGKLDIAAAGDSETFVFRNQASPGTLSAASFAPIYTVPSGGVELKVADFDGDGRPDLAVSAIVMPRAFHIHRNLSTPGNLQFGPRIATLSGGERFDVGDLNGDGSPDLVAGRDQQLGSGLFLIQNTIPVEEPGTGDGAPSIWTNPSDFTAALGGTASFAIRAMGSPTLAYQWHFAGAPIPEATNRVLTLSSLTFAQAGAYHVTVTNSQGAATSIVATLTVNFPPALVRVANVRAPVGQIDVPVELVANGNESALAFSLQFDASRLSYVAARVGGDALDASLIVNTNSKGRGRVGLSLSRPAEGSPFAAGVRQVVVVTFSAMSALTGSNQAASVTLPVNLTDDPVARTLISTNGGLLPAAYANGTVTLLLPTVRAGTVETVAGGLVGVPVTLEALGTENAIGFSLNFNRTVLQFAGIRAGTALPPSASFLINTNELAGGRVGVSLALPAGQALASGTNELFIVDFDVATVLQALTTPISFSDSPILRQVANVEAQRMTALFQPGSVAVATTAFEADVAPRPGGDRTLSVIDWAQVGRFAAALDPIDPGEFQRADCAPRSTRGNGVITIADWVQAGRYAANLDPLTSIGGPVAPAEPQPAVAAASAAGSRVELRSTNVLPGQTLTVPVILSTVGGENALGFSLSFNPARLRYLNAARSAEVNTATLNLNTNLAASGTVGVALALPPGSALAPGSPTLVVLTFAAAPDATGTTSLVFADAPIRREVVGALANALPTTFAGADVGFGPPGPVLNISRSGDGVLLFWSADEAGFELFSADTPSGGPWTKVSIAPVRIGDQKIISLPRESLPRYFRLQRP